LPPDWREEQNSPVNREISKFADLPISEILNYLVNAPDIAYTIEPEQNAVIFTLPKGKQKSP
jgi:hypothetical protein